MKPQNLFSTFLAVILLTVGSVSLADDSTSDMDMDVDVMTVNVNQADAATIANTLAGIGLLRAQAIVDYREQNGPFYSAEELTAVQGIGRITVERNMSRISTE